MANFPYLPTLISPATDFVAIRSSADVESVAHRVSVTALQTPEQSKKHSEGLHRDKTHRPRVLCNCPPETLEKGPYIKWYSVFNHLILVLRCVTQTLKNLLQNSRKPLHAQRLLTKKKQQWPSLTLQNPHKLTWWSHQGLYLFSQQSGKCVSDHLQLWFNEA